MYIPKIRYIKGAPKSYPLWDAITPDAGISFVPGGKRV